MTFVSSMKQVWKFHILFILLFTPDYSFGFDKVIIWGHKLHTHTHSYVHYGFFKAFQHLGYKTYWFDDQDDLRGFDFANSLFLTEGQVDHQIPLRNDCFYILHYCRSPKYKELFDNKRCITLAVYNDEFYTFGPNGEPESNSQPDFEQLIKIDTCVYYDPGRNRVYMPWATDLLPFEIEEIKKNLPIQKDKEKAIYWVGTMGGGTCGNINEISAFMHACNSNGIGFIHKDPWSGGISFELNLQLIQKSYMAPTIVGAWQNKVGYIPCRIFKNISYGQMGITNSQRVYELFEEKIIYNPDTFQLFYDAQQRLQTMTTEEIEYLMDLVKTKHTYINRIQVLIDCLKSMENNSNISKQHLP